MSYEQKYKKYKQKYLNLKNEILELEDNNKLINTGQLQTGGYTIGNGAAVTSMSGVPNASTCAGSVNPQPKVASSPTPQTVPSAPKVTKSKNLSEEHIENFTDEVTTTDLNNQYSDIEQMVSQLGGAEVYDPFDSVTNDSFSDSMSDDSMSGEYNTVYSPIASPDLPGRSTASGKGHQMNASASEISDGYGSSPFE